ncbi:MAG: glucokinase [Firmicutes bacterium]|nr:glucokinase [Bacillota bacterium]
MKMTLDIGGTKTLWTIWHDALILDRGTAATNTITDFTAFIKTLTGESSFTHIAFAIAGPVTDDKLQLTNTGQIIDLTEIRAAFPDAEIVVLNDLEALAHSINHLTEPDQLALFRSAASSHAKGAACDAKDAASGAKAILSIGTGLGVSAVSREGSIMPSEGGHIDFAPVGAKQRLIYDKLESRYGHVSYERLLSGQGLSNIFSIILEELESGDSDTMACRPRQKMHPAQITAMAKSGNKESLETFRIFSEILGAACGNYALTYMATGGIYIGGGMIPKILPLIDKEAFENAYLNKGRFKDFLDNIPVYVILDETAPSIGAMRAISL